MKPKITIPSSNSLQIVNKSTNLKSSKSSSKIGSLQKVKSNILHNIYRIQNASDNSENKEVLRNQGSSVISQFNQQKIDEDGLNNNEEVYNESNTKFNKQFTYVKRCDYRKSIEKRNRVSKHNYFENLSKVNPNNEKQSFSDDSFQSASSRNQKIVNETNLIEEAKLISGQTEIYSNNDSNDNIDQLNDDFDNFLKKTSGPSNKDTHHPDYNPNNSDSYMENHCELEEDSESDKISKKKIENKDLERRLSGINSFRNKKSTTIISKKMQNDVASNSFDDENIDEIQKKYYIPNSQSTQRINKVNFNDPLYQMGYSNKIVNNQKTINTETKIPKYITSLYKSAGKSRSSNLLPTNTNEPVKKNLLDHMKSKLPEITSDRLEALKEILQDKNDLRKKRYLDIIKRERYQMIPLFFDKIDGNSFKGQKNNSEIPILKNTSTEKNITMNLSTPRNVLNCRKRLLSNPLHREKLYMKTHEDSNDLIEKKDKPYVKKLKFQEKKGFLDVDQLMPSLRMIHDRICIAERNKDNSLSENKDHTNKTQDKNDEKILKENTSIFKQHKIQPHIALKKSYSTVFPSQFKNTVNLMSVKDSKIELETKQIDHFVLLKTYNTIFPEWLLERNDFKNSLYIQCDKKKEVIPKIVIKPIYKRSENDRVVLSSWQQSLDFLKHYDYSCIVNFGIKLEPLYFKTGDVIVRTKYQCDPICILYEGEVECMQTKQTFKHINLLWGIEADMDNPEKNYYYKLKRQGIVFRVNKNDYDSIMKNFFVSNKYRIKAQVEKIEMFSNKYMEKATLNVLLNHFKCYFARKNEVVYKMNTSNNFIYYLVEGKAKTAVIVDSTNKEWLPLESNLENYRENKSNIIVENSYEPGNAFAYCTTLLGQNKEENQIAEEDSIFLQLDCNVIKKTCSSTEGENLIHFITKRLEEIRHKCLQQLIKKDQSFEARKKSVFRSFKKNITNIKHVKTNYANQYENTFNFMVKSLVSNTGIMNKEKGQILAQKSKKNYTHHDSQRNIDKKDKTKSKISMISKFISKDFMFNQIKLLTTAKNNIQAPKNNLFSSMNNLNPMDGENQQVRSTRILSFNQELISSDSEDFEKTFQR